MVQAGDTVTLSANGQILGGQDGSRLVFQGWSVDGHSAQAGVSLPVRMDSPHVVTAQYKQQYYLMVKTDQGVASGEGWYDAGSTATIYVSTPVSTNYGVKIVFSGWQGAIQTNSQSAKVLMDSPKTAIASWGTDSTVLNLTIAVCIIAALLIAGSILAYAVLNRRSLPIPACVRHATAGLHTRELLRLSTATERKRQLRQSRRNPHQQSPQSRRQPNKLPANTSLF